MKNLRLWKNTRIVNLAPDGVATLGVGTLGYEWGEPIENGFQPAGVVRMSETLKLNVEKIVDFGATIGFGPATHSLTLYRHNSGALVFGASTVQWAWGLDGHHDRGTLLTHPPDQAIQQATVNLFAEMGAQPLSLQVGADPTRALVTTPASTDILAPTSSILIPAAGGTVESGNRTTISGTATELGGGTVGAVEVSVDGGTTWRRATGTSLWSIEWTPGAVGSANIRTRATDDSGNLESAGAGITVSVIVAECPCTSLWKPTVVPTTPSAADSNSYELGVKFQSDINGFITGIRFYKGPANTGTHRGSLWTSSGTLLASAIFLSETNTGWQQVSFGTPVAITANTTYVASYNVNSGGYAYDGGYFATNGVDSPPLHALPSGPSGGNGVGEEQSRRSRTRPAWPTTGRRRVRPELDDHAASDPNIKATAIDSSRATLSWSTNEQTSTRIGQDQPGHPHGHDYKPAPGL